MNAITINSAVDSAYDWLVENAGVEEQTLQVALNINGYTMQTIDSVCFVLFGCDYGQLDDGEV
jgi:hypothetical protein